MSGTSMATPQVAGVIALMYAAAYQKLIQDYRDDNGMIALLMRDFAFKGSDSLASMNGLVAHGRMDPLAAIDAVLLLPSISSIDYLCSNQDITFTLSNMKLCIETTWTSSPNVQIVSSTDTSATIQSRSSSSGDGWVRATLSNGGGVDGRISDSSTDSLVCRHFPKRSIVESIGECKCKLQCGDHL